MIRVIYILLGIAPSLVWLVYYLNKDADPEPKKSILKIYMGGALSAALAGILETILIRNWEGYYSAGIYPSALFFVAIAFIEEFAKYLPVRLEQWNNMEVDEPFDVAAYMITSAMGFAALENIFLFFTKRLRFMEIFFVSSFRFVGATFLHALCSGLLGYFIALSFYHRKTKKSLKARFLVVSGFIAATLLHALYNFSIIKVANQLRILFPLVLVGISALILSLSLKHLQKLKSICK